MSFIILHVCHNDVNNVQRQNYIEFYVLLNFNFAIAYNI